MSDLVDPTSGVFTQIRPWGQFQQFVSNQEVTVKIITIQPGHRLSLQKHNHRGEFWHVIDGPVDVEVGDDKYSAMDGEDVWVPLHSTHRIGNSSEHVVRILEIALGQFDETDIERYEDDYARHERDREDRR